MTDEESEFEFQQMSAFFGEENKNAGRIVTTKNGLKGRTYNYKGRVNGKVPVYTEKGAILCDPSTLQVNGFID